MLLHDLIINSACQYGDRPAVLRGNVVLDYTELAESVVSVAHGLVKIGAAPGERIAIYLNERIEAVVSYFAASQCGASSFQ